MKHFWRAVLLIQQDEGKQLDLAVQRIRSLGITEIHIFAEAGVRISKRFDHSLHQDATWDSPYKLWRGATEIMGGVYSADTELFLVTRPGCTYWDQLPVFCERTIDRSVVAVWSPLTPTRVFPSENDQRPRCKTDKPSVPTWCPTQVHADVGVHHCFVVTGHVLSLMRAYLPVNPEGADVGCTLAYELGRRSVPYMFAIPSVVQFQSDVNYSTHDFVSCAFHINQTDLREQSFMATPVRRRK